MVDHQSMAAATPVIKQSNTLRALHDIVRSCDRLLDIRGDLRSHLLEHAGANVLENNAGRRSHSLPTSGQTLDRASIPENQAVVASNSPVDHMPRTLFHTPLPLGMSPSVSASTSRSPFPVKELFTPSVYTESANEDSSCDPESASGTGSSELLESVIHRTVEREIVVTRQSLAGQVSERVGRENFGGVHSDNSRHSVDSGKRSLENTVLRRESRSPGLSGSSNERFSLQTSRPSLRDSLSGMKNSTPSYLKDRGLGIAVVRKQSHTALMKYRSDSSVLHRLPKRSDEGIKENEPANARRGDRGQSASAPRNRALCVLPTPELFNRRKHSVTGVVKAVEVKEAFVGQEHKALDEQRVLDDHKASSTPSSSAPPRKKAFRRSPQIARSLLDP